MRKFDQIFQFKIALKGIRPPIWRRIQVPSTYSFWDLHVAIQDAMGWTDCHLHSFEFGLRTKGIRESIGIPDPDFPDEDDMLPGWKIPIAKLFSMSNPSADYIYDFGDDWEHKVVLESILPRDGSVQYPRCIAGKRACPPEDCGGVWGYEELLEIQADPSHERHEEIMEWLGDPIDPESFNHAEVDFDDPAERRRMSM